MQNTLKLKNMLYKDLIDKRKVIFIQEKFGYVFSGSLGLSLQIPLNKKISIKENDSSLLLQSNEKSLFFLYKKLIHQKIIGVVYGFKKKLKLEGIGFVAVLDNNKLNLKLGFSHSVNIDVPSSIKILIKKRKRLILLGSDLNEVTQFAAKIRSYKVPEIYKGKGILYFKEKINLKVGKKT